MVRRREMVIRGLVKKVRPDQAVWPLIFLFLASTAAYTLLFIPFSNPIGHRYFMFAYLLFSLLAAYGIHKIQKKAIKIGVVAVLAVVLLSGHFCH